MDPGGEDRFCVHPREARRALRPTPLVDPFLCSRYSLSPYMACGHGCAYCDGRAEKYWVEGVFDRDIVVRRNLPALLRQELPRLRETAPIAIGSGITDAYQPLERTEGLTRECAAILADHAMPVSVLTKSALVQRDIDAWSTVNRGPGFILNLSIATLDEGIRRRFEPGASPIPDRLQALRAFRQRGVPVGVMAMPLLPFISDAEEDVRALLTALKEAGAAFVMPAGLTLRPGRQKDFYLQRVGEAYPDLLPRYREIYAENRASGACTRSYSTALQRRVASASLEAGVPFLLPHACYRGRLPLYDEIHLLLQHMAELYRARRVPTESLVSATVRYGDWLLQKKRVFNRRRSLTQEGLEQEARVLFGGAGGTDLLKNEKLAAFLRQVAMDRKVFDYTSLSLSAAKEPRHTGDSSGEPA